MSHATAGFQKISRHDNLFQEHVHDAYKARTKPHEPTVCPQCGAVFMKGAGSGLASQKAHTVKLALLVTAYTSISSRLSEHEGRVLSITSRRNHASAA